MQHAIISIKDKLHQTIECIEDEKVLEAFNTILEGYRNEAENYELTNEQLTEVEKREADHLSGKTKSYKLEDFRKIMNEKYGY